MRRGWVLAGAVMLAAAPAVPVAVVGVSGVLELVGEPEGEAGKWIRTGDVQRYRVRPARKGRRHRMVR